MIAQSGRENFKMSLGYCNQMADNSMKKPTSASKQSKL